MRRRLIVIGVVAILALALVAVGLAGKPNWQKKDELVSDAIASQLIGAVPYPTSQMKDSLERRNLRERLLRFNKPQKIGYLYLMSFGKFVGYYVVKGKITSTQSQMTTSVQTWSCGDMDGGCSVDSIGDDGSFGPNEGGDKGVFFFTATGVMVETTLDWVYSDAPLRIDVPNLLTKK
jgi:hypothetical protein